MPLINSKILMSDANNFADTQPINPYYNHAPIVTERANNEHRTIRQLLIDSGVDVINVPSPVGCQDGVYTANWALVRGGVAVLASLPNARKDEEPYAEKILKNLGKKVIHVPNGLKFSGQGDALACGNLLFCGSGYRSDKEAQKFAAETLGFEQVQLKTIPATGMNGSPIVNKASGWPDSFFYDIDLALSIIKPPIAGEKGLIAYCPEAFTTESRELLSKFNGVDKIEVSIEEARDGFANNLVSTGEVVIMSSHAPKLTSALRDHGLKVITPEIVELDKGGGYIRCITLTLD